MHYFAYGSNMLTRRLAAVDRAPSARPIAIGTLPGRRLRFHKIGLDGSGKCDAALTGKDSDRIYGVLFELDRADQAALDRLECAGGGYVAEIVRVALPVGYVDAATYIARRTRPGLQPFHWYKALVVAGALEHGLPAAYVAGLRAVASIDDPDDARRQRNETLLVQV